MIVIKRDRQLPPGMTPAVSGAQFHRFAPGLAIGEELHFGHGGADAIMVIHVIPGLGDADGHRRPEGQLEAHGLHGERRQDALEGVGVTGLEVVRVVDVEVVVRRIRRLLDGRLIGKGGGDAETCHKGPDEQSDCEIFQFGVRLDSPKKAWH